MAKQTFSYLKKNKIFFQNHYSKIAGKPDIAIPSKKIAVFIDGDFWHGYRFESWKRRIPKKYWREKIKNNILRDRNKRAFLRRRGWKIMRIWGHEILKKTEKTLEKIAEFLKS